MNQDQIRDMIKEIVGAERANIVADGEKLVQSLTAQFGTLTAAKAAGQETNVFARHNVDGAGTESKKSGSQFMAGRFLRGLAAGRGSMAEAKAIAAERGDKEMVDVYERAISERKAKAMSLSDFSAGGALVPEQFSTEVIGLLYPQLTVMALGADTIPMPNGNLTIPYLDSGVSAAYVGETAVISSSAQTVGQIQLQAKKLAAVVPISNDLLRTPSARADAFVQNDLIRQLQVRADQALLRGVGASGEPRGVRNFAVSGNVFAQTGTTLAAKVTDLGKCQRVIQELNVPILKGGYVVSPRTEWGLRLTLDSLGNFIFKDMMNSGQIMGFPFKSSTTVLDTGGGGSESEVIFAAFAHVIVGDTETLELTVAPDGAYHNGSSVVSGLSQDVTPMRAIARHDLACRYRGKEVSVITGVTWA